MLISPRSMFVSEMHENTALPFGDFIKDACVLSPLCFAEHLGGFASPLPAGGVRWCEAVMKVSWWLWGQGLYAAAWQTSRAAASLFVWREAMAMGPSLSFVAGIKNLVCKQEPLFRFTRHACGGRRPLFWALVPRKWEGTLREGSWSPGCLLHVEPRTKVGR